MLSISMILLVVALVLSIIDAIQTRSLTSFAVVCISLALLIR